MKYAYSDYGVGETKQVRVFDGSGRQVGRLRVSSHGKTRKVYFEPKVGPPRLIGELKEALHIIQGWRVVGSKRPADQWLPGTEAGAIRCARIYFGEYL